MAPSFAQPAPQTLDDVVVTGTRTTQSAEFLPMSIDRIDAQQLRESGFQVNLSEGLQRVPGLNIQSRSNYSQDLQISSRGFGARASFGVRGIRLFADGIPATQADGQGQVSHFSLSSADRVEVLRGPFATLYGNAAGGVIQIFTEEPGPSPQFHLDIGSGSNQTSRTSIKSLGGNAWFGWHGEFGSFETAGFRPHSAATKQSGNLRLSGEQEGLRWSIVFNSLAIDSLDPLGLNRPQLDSDPQQTISVASLFNTRKLTQQDQLGMRIEKDWGNQKFEFLAYAGDRAVTQWQSIPVATQTPALHPGGVIDFDRRFVGLDLRYQLRWGQGFETGSSRASLVFGISTDQTHEDRRGYENFVGSTLGVTGRLRRNETNRIRSNDWYAQLQWTPHARWLLLTGLRQSQVRFRSNDQFIIAGINPDDSGATQYSQSTPAIGLTFKARPHLNVYWSSGLGFETPTFNELAYRPNGQSGLNFELRPSRSINHEIGLKGRLAFESNELLPSSKLRYTFAVYQSRTTDELSTLTNQGGRSTFQNVGRTHRQGVELSAEWQPGEAWTLNAMHYVISATYRDRFATCNSVPCLTPNANVAAGNIIPGVPESATNVGLNWRQNGWSIGVDWKRQGRVFVNDLNTTSAPSFDLWSARVGYQHRLANWTLDWSLRVENMLNTIYAGTVIVNEGNGRFFEPGPPRDIQFQVRASWKS